MITLIIFLVLITYIIFKKIKINIDVRMDGFKYTFKIKAFSKEKISRGDFWEFIKSGEGNFNLELVKEISSLININKLSTNIEIGTEFIFLTNLITVIVSTVIPMLYNFPVNSKQNLSFDVKPYYDKFCFVIHVRMQIELTMFELFIIYLKYKKIKYINSKSTQINRRY